MTEDVLQAASVDPERRLCPLIAHLFRPESVEALAVNSLTCLSSPTYCTAAVYVLASSYRWYIDFFFVQQTYQQILASCVLEVNPKKNFIFIVSFV